MNSNLNSEIRSATRWSIALSVIMMIAGILCILVPFASGMAATIFVGSLLVVAGIAHITFAWHLPGGGGFWWGILLGILCTVTGGYTLLHPLAGLASLTIVLAAWFFMQAMLEFALAISLRHLKGVGWMVLDGICALVLGALICLTWPINTFFVIGTLAGVSLICGGVARLIFSIVARRTCEEILGDGQQDIKIG